MRKREIIGVAVFCWALLRGAVWLDECKAQAALNEAWRNAQAADYLDPNAVYGQGYKP